MKLPTWWAVLAASGLLLFAAGPASAFGTVRSLGQNAEHERITRHALGCGLFGDKDCVQAKTLTELAGGDRNFGAIGIPDRGSLVTKNKAHCDSGDYLDVPDYPNTRSQARQALENCRAWMMEKLQEAVTDAGELVDAQGRLRGDRNCPFPVSSSARSRATPSAT